MPHVALHSWELLDRRYVHLKSFVLFADDVRSHYFGMFSTFLILFIFPDITRFWNDLKILDSL